VGRPRHWSARPHAQLVETKQPIYDTTYKRAELQHSMFARTMPTDDSAICFYDQCSISPNRRFVQPTTEQTFVVRAISPPERRV